MGNNCVHARTEVVDTKIISTGFLTKTNLVTLKCLDCLTNNKPTVIKKEITMGRLTGKVYDSKSVTRENCAHENFTVDPETMKNDSEATLGGTILSLLTAHWVNTRCYFTTGVGKCEAREAKFKVRSDYHVETEWKDYQQITREVHSEWKIMRTPQRAEPKSDEIIYVN